MTHPRQAAKLQALKELGEGANDYRTFNRASSFGQIHGDDFVKARGYRPGLRWSTTYSNDPDAYAKDHMLSRSWAYKNHGKVAEVLSPELALSLMRYAVRYNIPPQSLMGGTLTLMAVLCGHHKNAEVMTVRDNSRKGADCSITLQQLAARIQA